MEISIPRERDPLEAEARVPLSPRGCQVLVHAGHKVWVEAGAGDGACYFDEEYGDLGATVVWTRPEAWTRGELVLKVGRPSLEEVELLREGGAVAGFLSLASSPDDVLQALVRRRITALDLELVEQGGERPVLVAMSELAGRMCPQLAARYLETIAGGRGVLLSGAPGIAPADVVVLGAGTVGANAATAFAAVGAHVTVLDIDVPRLRQLERFLPGRATLIHATRSTIARSAEYADVLVGAVLVPGERAPVLVDEATVARMRPGSVILDLAIDHGGCVATSRPTTLADPVFRVNQVLHYCAPNVPALVARTASYALSQALGMVFERVRGSVADAVRPGGPLASAAVMVGGLPVSPAVARGLGVAPVSLDDACNSGPAEGTP